jgi:hypothetical protein
MKKDRFRIPSLTQHWQKEFDAPVRLRVFAQGCQEMD